MIKYLIKFVSKREFAEDLLNGKLFMRPAEYYHRLEKGQGDFLETAISHSFCIYKHSTVPIYCAYAVDEKDVIDNKILVPSQCIKDFDCEHGYAVLIDYSKFEPLLRKIDSKGYEVVAGLVNYHRLDTDDTFCLIGDDSVRNCFIKHPSFFYQKEFRIVIEKKVYKAGEKPIDYIEYWISEKLNNEVAKVIDIALETESIGNNFVIHCENIF